GQRDLLGAERGGVGQHLPVAGVGGHEVSRLVTARHRVVAHVSASSSGRAISTPTLSRQTAVRVTIDLPRLGFGLPVAGRWAPPDTIRRIARRAEALGYASLWTFQRVLHTDELGPSHRSVLDPVVPLAYVAGHTDRIRLGTATICAPFTAPALL